MTTDDAPPAAAPLEAPPTRRERVRAATVAEIREVARRHVVAQGGAALNLRAVAREMGMTPSALYRYYESRDALLTALVVESYDEVGELAEAAAAALPRGGAGGVEAFLTVVHALRDWAVGRPHEFALLFGTPVPGYEPPEDALPHELRVANVLLQMLVGAVDGEQVDLSLSDDDLEPRLRTALAEVCDADHGFSRLTPAEAALALTCWSTLLGALAAEVFGHHPPQVAAAPREMFELTMRRSLASVGFTTT